MEHDHTYIRMLEAGHQTEKRSLEKRLKEVQTDMRTLKIGNSKMRKNIEERTGIEEDLRKKLEAVKEQDHTYIRMLEAGHQTEKRSLEKRLKDVQTDVQAMKIRISKIRKNIEERTGIEEDLRKKLEAVKEHDHTYIRMLEAGHQTEKRSVEKRLKEVQTDMRTLKMKKSIEERMGIEDGLQKELGAVKEHDHTYIRMLEAGHQTEKRGLEKRLKEVQTDMRTLKIGNSKMRKNIEERTGIEEDLRKKLEAVKEQDHTYIRMLEAGHQTEKRSLEKRLKDVQTDMQAMKIGNSKIRNNIEEMTGIAVYLRKKLEAVKEHDHTYIRMLEAGHQTEKRSVEKRLKEVQTDMRTLKMKKSIEERMGIEDGLQKELGAVKEHDHTYIRMLEAGHQTEKRSLEKRLKEVQTDMRTLKIGNSKMRKNIEERTRIEEDLRKELEAVKDENRKLKVQHEIELKTVYQDHQREKKSLIQHRLELRNTVRSLKITTTRSKKMWETEMKMSREGHKEETNALTMRIKELQQEVQSVKNNLEEKVEDQAKKHQEELECYVNEKKEVEKKFVELKNNLEEKLKDQAKKHQEELECYMNEKKEVEKKLVELKGEYIKLKTQLESQRKIHDEEKGDLRTRNDAIQQELEALKARVPRNNLPLAINQTGPQGHTETSVQPKICIDNFHPIRILGEGGFGKVLLVNKRPLDGPDQHFAMKILKKSHILRNCGVAYTITEKQALVLASGHPFITTLYSCFQTKEHLFFIMDFVSGGSMIEELRKVRMFSEKDTQFYTAEITLALEFLHRYGILHRDLKLDNILIDGDGHCKVADFGLSKLGVFEGCKVEGVGGTRRYMAPEMLQGLPYGQGIDWWALGIIMYIMMTGKFPFNDHDEIRLQQKIRFHEVIYPMGISKEAELIMRKLLRKDPTMRLGAYSRFDSIRQQAFFRGIDWRAMQEKRIKPPHKPNIVKEMEGNLTFKELLKPDMGTHSINQEQFDGFSFINHGVPQ